MTRLSKFLAAVTLAVASVGTQAGVIEYNAPNVSNYSSTDAIRGWFSTGNIDQNIESFTLSMRWRDQGWGNRKGRIYYRTDTSGWQNLGILAQHYWTNPVVTVLNHFDTSRLHFGYVVGGGGGHRLFIRNAKLSVSAVPEPAALGLFAAGVAGLVLLRRRKAAMATR